MGVMTEDEAGCRGIVQRLPRRSLAISPNLDKLLEHEERSRWSNATIFPVEAPMSSATMPGLPPPPRSRTLLRNDPPKKRNIISPVVALSNSPLRSSNPYINPPPTAEELFLLSHDSARPVSGPSQQSTHSDDHQQNLFSSFLRKPHCFKAETLGKGEDFPVSPISPCMFPNSLHHRCLIPRTPEEDFGFAAHSTNTVEFQASFGFSSAVSAAPSTGMLSNISLDPTAHRISVSEISPLDNQSSSHTSSLSTTQSMATPPPESPTLECHSGKPLLPTTPKPVFSRHPSLLRKQLAPNSLPFDMTNAKPATRNFLDGEERADLVRRSRKLARLFGETPNAEAVTQAGLVPTLLAHRKKSEPDARRRDPHGPDGVNTFSRRHSVPLRADDMPFLDFSAGNADGNLGPPKLSLNRSSSSPEDETVQSSSRHQPSSIRSRSPVSFIELSDDGSSTSVASRTSFYSLKTSSIDLRRRKRERLAKLYRFLGSQVPINLVLGKNDDSAASSPPQQQIPSNRYGFDKENRRNRRRMSSSAIPSASTWSDDVERLKADLDDREKAIIVRRAQKMEKLFGVAPPLTLYYPHSASAPPSGSATPFLHTDDFPSYSSAALKSSKQKQSRPATPESSKRLLTRTDSFARFHSFKASRGSSTFYNHFDHSLNSLNDIIDRDDKASLAELHQSLRNDIVTALPHATVASGSEEGDDDTTTPTCSSHRSSMSSLLPRHELGAFPARTSMISLDSENNIAISSAIPQAASFQQRRKRAAKLSHFFGVDYRELFDDVLESIENDMQVGERDGTLRAEEVEDLLQKLRKLKYKRQTFL